MSGARLALTSVNALEALSLKTAVATMCIGVGQGIAMLIERA
jgi:acetyl-CoA acetyltransferase